ncbi:MAG: hypothetical protein MUP71_04885 [Candidatus Aminicenantes bacterium]|nr:hypothetical protein [Candidatus Aminicenantes bacterium]
MIKKQQKWIALLVTLTFMGLLQVSTMPVAATIAPEQISSTNAEQAPSFIEEEGDSSSPAKKKSILPIILIGVGVAAVAAVLFLVVFKTKYDITGDWTLTWKYEDEDQNSNTITFSGDKKTGSFTIGSGVGTYTVDAKKVQWIYSDGQTIYTGEFTDKTHMSGTMLSWGYDGTWSAVKKATTASIGTPAAVDKTANGEKQK